MDTCHYTFPKIHRKQHQEWVFGWTRTLVNNNVSHQCINCDKCTKLMGDVNNGERRGRGERLYRTLWTFWSFFCKVKTALKKNKTKQNIPTSLGLSQRLFVVWGLSRSTGNPWNRCPDCATTLGNCTPSHISTPDETLSWDLSPIVCRSQKSSAASTRIWRV